jgi:dTDP-4-dehydrorhamnose reductase
MSQRQWPEVWAGLEGTINRVGDRYFDQCARTGHRDRLGDLDLFAALGIKALRYPVLWEANTLANPFGVPFAHSDQQLARMQQLGLRPIVGLVHHGSGPRSTDLLDMGFADGLAQYAGLVAARYPWIQDYTPVNEPLTTARFSALYGHWYPHRADYASFARALIVQCRAIVLAMRAIRRVNPTARLIQTEDMGRTYSTAALAYQADFENMQRWLSFDLLCGHVTREHPFYERLLMSGIGADALAFFWEEPTPPDVVGLNYYVTSDRLLDERMERYPPASHGGNERHCYADVEAVRAWPDGLTGHQALLEVAWQRYRHPVALTEVHLGCTREEQLRWLAEAWEAAHAARQRGADVHAITVWSLLGAFDWNSLVTTERGDYEPGVFDIRSGTPRPTALAPMLQALATTGSYAHPVLVTPGWWRRSNRLFGSEPTRHAAPASSAAETTSGPCLVIVGATGTLGQALARVCAIRGLTYKLLGRAELDIACEASVQACVERLAPWAIVNAAGYVRVDEAERDTERCFRENTTGPHVLARACAQRSLQLVTFSSDLVFNGVQRQPYVESDAAEPLNVYGRSKLEAERRVLSMMPSALVIRTGAFFGPWDCYNFLHHGLSALAEGREFVASHDMIVSPTYVPDLAHACLDLLIDGEQGVWHLTNTGAVTWVEFARRAAALTGLDGALVRGAPAAALGLLAPRPQFSALTSERGCLLPTLDDALQRFVAARVVC